MPADVLRLRNLRFYGHHGVFPEETRLGQRFEVDVEIHADLAQAGRDDDLDGTVDYPAICRLVEEVVTGPPFKLIEAVAEHIAMRIGERYAPVELIVRVRKPDPPVAMPFDGVEVEVRRAYA